MTSARAAPGGGPRRRAAALGRPRLEDVRRRERRRIAGVLEPPFRDERIGAIEEQRSHREDREEADDEQDQDLAVLAARPVPPPHQWFTTLVDEPAIPNDDIPRTDGTTRSTVVVTATGIGVPRVLYAPAASVSPEQPLPYQTVTLTERPPAIAAAMTAFLIDCFDGEGYGHDAEAAGTVVARFVVTGPTGHAVESPPPWTIAYRAPSRAAFARLSFAQTTRPKSTMPRRMNRKTG